jgi:hypothetical protein
MNGSTTIRVPQEFREILRRVSAARETSLTDTLNDALAALRREEFFDAMASSEAALRADPVAWAEYLAEADEWATDLDGHLGAHNK